MTTAIPKKLTPLAENIGGSTVAVVLGLTTAVVDFFVHPRMSAAVALEALVTGSGAALLSYLLGQVIKYRRDRREAMT